METIWFDYRIAEFKKSIADLTEEIKKAGGELVFEVRAAEDQRLPPCATQGEWASSCSIPKTPTALRVLVKFEEGLARFAVIAVLRRNGIKPKDAQPS